MVDSVLRFVVVLDRIAGPSWLHLHFCPLHSTHLSAHRFHLWNEKTFFFTSIAGKQEEVPTVWEVFVVVVVFAALGWLIAMVLDHHRHA